MLCCVTFRLLTLCIFKSITTNTRYIQTQFLRCSWRFNLVVYIELPVDFAKRKIDEQDGHWKRAFIRTIYIEITRFWRVDLGLHNFRGINCIRCRADVVNTTKLQEAFTKTPRRGSKRTKEDQLPVKFNSKLIWHEFRYIVAWNGKAHL
jgi:hypothetical protein